MIEKHGDVLKIFDAIQNEGGDARFVGGCVRDFLLNESNSDIDIATTLLPTQILALPGFKTAATGLEYGTISIFINKACYQITTLRQDVKCEGRRATVKFGTSWEEDAKRRDFTINSLSIDRDGRVFDYCGGVEDLRKRIIRFIGDPNQRIQEDYLRILRFFRFTGRFSMEFDQIGLNACKLYADKLQYLSKERVREEFLKILSNNKSTNVLQHMHQANILQQIIPWASKKELELLEKLEQQNHHCRNNIVKLFLLCRSEKDIVFLRKNLLLSNHELNSLKIFEKYMNLEWNKILYHCANLVTELAIIRNVALNDVIHIDDYAVWEQPKLPVSSEDLIALGYREKILGRMLEKATNAWITSNFSFSKNDIISEIKAL